MRDEGEEVGEREMTYCLILLISLSNSTSSCECCAHVHMCVCARDVRWAYKSSIEGDTEYTM